MKSRTLGKHGFEVSEIGLGCWQIGGNWGDSPIAEEQAIHILHTASENGVTFFDTADVYGDGRSETLIGQFLKQTDKTIRVATKFGRGADAYPDQYSNEVLRKSIERSLTRLGVDRLDLLQLHCIPSEVLRRGDIFDHLRSMQSEGLIQHFGASVETVEEGLLCMEQEGLVSLQVIFNIFRQKLVSELLPVAEEKGVGVVVRLPLASGLLAGKMTKETRFAEEDHRNFNRDGQCFNVGETFAGLPFEKGLELVDQIKELLPPDLTMAQLALRWILDHDAVSSIIPGASSPRQAEANSQISELAPLAPDLHKKLSEFYNTQVHTEIRGAY